MIRYVDEFILYDDVQYTKNDWRNRNKIKTRNGAKWITIPVSQKSLSQRICEITVVNSYWRKKHWKFISQCYSKAKYFKDFKDVFEVLYLGSDDLYLSQINYMFIKAINKVLGINTMISWSMDYHLAKGRTERLVDLCKQAGATEYISGPAAKHYMAEELFSQENIAVHYIDYSDYPKYNQLFPPFTHLVSVIDLIFNEGPNSLKFMKGF